MRQNISLALLGLFAFAVYAVHRLRFVGDCDSWAYFAQAELFLGRDPGLHTFLDPLRHDALTPLGMDVARGGFVSAFPPGYSVLLALAGLVDGQYWVNPFLGAASVVLVYMAIARDAPHRVALVGALLWGTCPLVIMNATDVMSDMAATVALLGCYVLLRYARFRAAGLLFGLSLMIRPMNLLFLAPAALLLPSRTRPLLEFAACFALGALVSAGTHIHVWGALLSPTYQNNARHFHPRYFPRQFPGYMRETALHLGPILALGLLEGARAPRKNAPELVWLGAFFLVYPFAGPVDIDWTRPRFLLPAYPAAFVLATRAVMDLFWFLHGKSGRALAGTSLAIGAAALSWGIFGVARSRQLGVLQIHPERDAECDLMAARLPRNALVGALEYSGSLRLYAGIETFVWPHPQALAFAQAEYARGRPVYLLLEPDEFLRSVDAPFAARFTVALDLAPEFAVGNEGYIVRRVVGMREPGVRRIVLTDPLVKWALLDGWLGPDELWGSNYRATRCDLATLRLLLEPGVAQDLQLIAAAPEGGAPRMVEVAISGRSLGSARLGPELSASTFRIPSELAFTLVRPGRAIDTVALELRFPGAPKCNSHDRRAVARVQAVETRIVER